ncbi:MAG: nitrite reductase small subunit NirD [Bacteroidota bacterium]|nr:nitrite reductase small subunit NirD [Candidatus Kapabacteria bacterium]MDW8220835.1 nitrite reductase small subunit NirD [Bacteroidota bacterium]
MTIYPNDDFPQCEQHGKAFVRVCKSSDLVQKQGICVEFNEYSQIAVFRVDDALYAVSNICPHNHMPLLHKGFVNTEACSITCPMHGWEYSLRTGQNVASSHSRLHVYEVFESNGWVYLEKPQTHEPAWVW